MPQNISGKELWLWKGLGIELFCRFCDVHKANSESIKEGILFFYTGYCLMVYYVSKEFGRILGRSLVKCG